MVCLGKEQRSFCHFWDCIQVLHFRLFCWPWWLSISSKGFLPIVVDIMVIWVKLYPFQSIWVRWFLECRCSLLPSPVWPLPICLDSRTWHSRFLCNIALYSVRTCFYHVTYTTGYCFCFVFIPSFFLQLFLHWSPVAYWAPTDLESSSFSILSFCLCILLMGFSRQEYWSALPFPSPVDHILSDLSTMTCPSWVSPQGMA